MSASTFPPARTTRRRPGATYGSVASDNGPRPFAARTVARDRRTPRPRRQLETTPGSVAVEPEAIAHELAGRHRHAPFDRLLTNAVVIGLGALGAALVAAYMLVPGLPRATSANPGVLGAAFDISTVLVVALDAYLVGLSVVGFFRSRTAKPRAARREPFFVLAIPARNEEARIGETVRRVLALDSDRFLALLVDDGSTDATAQAAREAAGEDRRLLVLERHHEDPRRGRSDVLNRAVAAVERMVERDDPRLLGTSVHEIVVGVLNAGAWLRPDALRAVAPYFDHQRAAAVQVPIRAYDARTGLLAGLQDMDLVGRSGLVQSGRDALGTATLQGSGAFLRLSALRQLGPEPWPDLPAPERHIGLRLVESAWRVRACPLTCVALPASHGARARGRYGAWSHLPAIWDARRPSLAAKIEMTFHLLCAAALVPLGAQALLGAAGLAGAFPIEASLLGGIAGSGVALRGAVLALVLMPALLLMPGRRRLPLWALPGMLFAYAAYACRYELAGTRGAEIRRRRAHG